MNKKKVIFCDFDGTITNQDNILAIMDKFQPDGWEDIVQQLIAQKLSIRQAVGAMFALLPSSEKQEIIDYTIQQATIRIGFDEFVTYCSLQDIELFVTSGGIDFFIYPLLAPYAIDHSHIYCNQSSFASPYVEIVWPHPCDTQCDQDCGMCKTTIIRSYDANTYHRILIGDSLTDFAGAQLVETRFARSYLIELCTHLGLTYTPFEDFHTIIHALEEMNQQ
jgi:2-hydroxy-3-keto-5-methylthiopentenyl-1-phosphate phosphatase